MPQKPTPTMEIELKRRVYNVAINGDTVSFSVYGDEDDLDTLEMLIGYLAKLAAEGLDDDDN